MSSVAPRLKSFLEDSHVEYQTLQHVVDFTAQETAADTHTPGVEFAKTVLLEVDGNPALAVLRLPWLNTEPTALEINVPPAARQ